MKNKNSCLIENDEKLKKEFPSEYEYKIIGLDVELMEIAVSEAMSCDYTIAESKKNGKYISLRVSFKAESLEHSRDVFQKLSSHKDIKFTL